jgi:hypothetical protein
MWALFSYTASDGLNYHIWIFTNQKKPFAGAKRLLVSKKNAFVFTMPWRADTSRPSIHRRSSIPRLRLEAS